MSVVGGLPQDEAYAATDLDVIVLLLAVLLWLPVVARPPNAEYGWLAMAVSSTFARNLTILGSMANLIVAERAKSRAENIAFWDYARVGVPVTVLTMIWGIAWLALSRGGVR